MRWIFLLAVILFILPARAQNLEPSLSAGDLAEVLGMYWWNVEIPSDLGPKDSVTAMLINAHGKPVGQVASIRPGSAERNMGSLVRVFCWEDKPTKRLMICLQVKGGAITCWNRDFFSDGTYSGVATGSTLKPNEFMMKLKVSKRSVASIKPTEGLASGEIGLQVVVTRG